MKAPDRERDTRGSCVDSLPRAFQLFACLLGADCLIKPELNHFSESLHLTEEKRFFFLWPGMVPKKVAGIFLVTIVPSQTSLNIGLSLF